MHVLVYRRYHLLSDGDAADAEFDAEVARLLAGLGGALVARTKAALPALAGTMGGWHVSMQALPSRDAYLRLLAAPEYAAALARLEPHVAGVESVAVADVIDRRADPAGDCAWRRWEGFDPLAPLPFDLTSAEGIAMAGMLAGPTDDGLPLQVWNVDQLMPNATRFPGGPPDYMRMAQDAGWRAGGIHSVVMGCPQNECDTDVIDGDLLAGINSIMLVQYPSARAMARMVNDPGFDGSAKYAPGYFVKNADVPARVVNDGIARIPSPLARDQGPQQPTDCSDPAYLRARRAEAAEVGGARCDVDSMWGGIVPCAEAVGAGHCGARRSCAEWVFGSVHVCTGATPWSMVDMAFSPPQDPATPHGASVLASGLWHRALRNGAVDACRGG